MRSYTLDERIGDGIVRFLWGHSKFVEQQKTNTRLYKQVHFPKSILWFFFNAAHKH